MKQWARVRRECSKFKSVRDRISAMQLTGNPSDDDLDRYAQLVFSEGGTVTSHLYDCIRNPHYIISKPFPFVDAYKHLDLHTTLLVANEGNKEEGEKAERPDGVKASKKNKKL